MKNNNIIRIEDIEKKVENKIVSIFDKVDDMEIKKNTKVISVDLDRKFDFLRKYSDNKVSLDLIEYLIDRIDKIRPRQKIAIRLNKRCELDVNAIPLIKEGLKEEYKKSLRNRDENNLKQLWLFSMGAFILFLSTKIPANLFWKEVLVIIGWVPIWEMIEVELFPDAKERRRRKAIKRLLKCDIVERTVVNEKIEQIEISRTEDVI